MAKLLGTKPLPIPQIKSLTIEITGDEADALLTILNNVGGNSENTRRGLVDNVARVLSEVLRGHHLRDVIGTLTFKPLRK